MFLELRISFRFLLSKAKERFISIITWLAVLGIAMSVMMLIVVISVMTGFQQELKDKILGINSDINLSNRQGIIQNYENMIQKVDKIQDVVGVSPYVAGQVIIRIHDKISGVYLRGVEPELESNVSRINQYLVEGRLPDKGFEVIIGKEMARLNRLSLGDIIQVYSPTPLENPSLKTFREAMAKINDVEIVGIFDSGMYEYDVSLIYVPLDFAQDLFQLGNGVHGLYIKLTDSELAYLIKKELQTMFPYPYVIKGWMDLNRRLFRALQTEKKVMFILLAFAIVVAATNIISTLVMVVMEKTREIGILKAIGTSNFNMGVVFIFLGFLIGFVGTLLGTIGGLGFVLKLDNIEKWVSKVFGYKLFPPDIYYFDSIPAQIDFFDTALIAFCAIILSIISAWYPAWRAARLNPVEAIKYE